MASLPKYTVRYSKRAKYVRLAISTKKGLEVILPFNSSADCIPALLKEKQQWINKHLNNKVAPVIKPNLPETIVLQAIDLTLNVDYISSPINSITIEIIDGTLRLTGDVKNQSFVQHALIVAIKNLAKAHFNEKAEALASKHHFKYSAIKVRGQKTRWGSCSSRGNINLNYKLLFMPASYLHYVILHEFTHTIEMNHSAQFWSLLEKVLPNSKHHDQLMKTADKYIPAWNDYEFA